MSVMTAGPPDDFVAQLYADLSDDLNGLLSSTDLAVRRRHTGGSVADVRDAAEAAFNDVGIHLTEEQLDAYADAVAAGRPYEFRIG
jgi:hypothetical protein